MLLFETITNNNRATTNNIKRQSSWFVVGWGSPDCTNTVVWAYEGNGPELCVTVPTEAASISFITAGLAGIIFGNQYCSDKITLEIVECQGDDCCYNGSAGIFSFNYGLEF